MIELVKYPYNREEKEQLADRITAKQAEIWQKEAEKAQYTRTMTGIIKDLTDELSVLNTNFRCGYEMREAEVLVLYDEPQPGMKKIIVAGTSEFVREERMTPEEMQQRLDFQAGENYRAGES